MGEPTDSANAGAAVTHAAVTAVWRRESARLVAALTRMTGDVGLAEDLVQDALVAALDQWPRDGVPGNAGAWLMTTAKRRAVDHFRRAETLRRRAAELEHGLEEVEVPGLDAQVDHIVDDVLRLMFLCCHPALTPDSRAALTLRLVGGLTTAEIARGFLVAESAVGQRISRAKRTLADAGAQFELPTGADRLQRLDDVMAVVYLVFNEGYTATVGTDWIRPDLCHEAIRLARILVGLVPDEPELHSLQALLELQASRLPARTDDRGQPVLLDDQDRRRWDRLLIRRGQAALARAEQLARSGRPVGRYYLQAAIAAQHACVVRADDTDWGAIAGLYDVLAQSAPGPVIEVNRAVAHGRAFGPEAGLEVLDAVPADALAGSPAIPAVRGDLLARLGRYDEAAQAFRAAAAASRNEMESTLLSGRAEQAAAGRSTTGSRRLFRRKVGGMSSAPDGRSPQGREQPWSDETPEHGQVVVVTDNPIGRAVVEIARIAGRRATLLGDEDAEQSPLEWLADHPLDGRDALVLCDHDTPDMDSLLRQALAGQAGYVAMMGSRRRAESVFSTLAETLPPETLARLHVPAGLDTGGKGPGEIALSVVAEIVAVSYGRDGGPMKGR